MDMLNDNVGKKIVEALKMQHGKSDLNNYNSDEVSDFEDFDSSTVDLTQIPSEPKAPEMNFSNDSSVNFTGSVESAFQQSLARNLGNDLQSVSFNDIDCPQNVAILNNLISKLPVGVSKQTGALIIKQTIEALGIPMSSVLQEARQVQDSLIANARECQNNIIEYKKQITVLEHKGQILQKQAVLMNDIINLFAKN